MEKPACVNGKLLHKSSKEMSNIELADFIEQGAWRYESSSSDESAYKEAARRLRQ